MSEDVDLTGELSRRCGTGSVSDLPLRQGPDLRGSGRWRSPYRTGVSSILIWKPPSARLIRL